MIEVFYFGCGSGSAGHYWWEPFREASASFSMFHSHTCAAARAFPEIDGRYTPNGTRGAQGSAALTVERGWTVLAWHDYSVDKRGGSNSALVARGEFSIGKMLELLAAHFPAVSQRQPVPITLATQVLHSERR